MTEIEKRNLFTGILGTVAVHLFVLCILLIGKLDKVKTAHNEKLLIEFADDVEHKPIQEIIKEDKPELKETPKLNQEELKNIAVNTAKEFDEKISTEKYEHDLMKELGMLDDEKPQEPIDNGEVAVQNEPVEQPEKDKEQAQFKGKTRIEYYLENRTHKYLYKPIYRCESGGTVIVNIVVNQKGEVISSDVKEANTDEYCVIQMALEASKESIFNTDYNASPRQKGTIKYIFSAQ